MKDLITTTALLFIVLICLFLWVTRKKYAPQNKHTVYIFWSDQDGGFIAISRGLRGLSAFGETREEALREYQEAEKMYLEVLEEDGEPRPDPLTHEDIESFPNYFNGGM